MSKPTESLTSTVMDAITPPKQLTQPFDLQAIYQKYLGWYDANPANLHALPPAPSASYLSGLLIGEELAQPDA